MPAAAFLDLTILSLSRSSGSGWSNELIARRTSLGAGKGAGVPSHCGRCESLSPRHQSDESIKSCMEKRRGRIDEDTMQHEIPMEYLFI